MGVAPPETPSPPGDFSTPFSPPFPPPFSPPFFHLFFHRKVKYAKSGLPEQVNQIRYKTVCTWVATEGDEDGKHGTVHEVVDG